MIRIRIFSMIIFTAILFFGCENTSKVDEGHPLIVGLNANYPPYESYNQDGEIEGLDIDVAKILGQKLGLEVTIKDISFDALILALNQGKIDLIISGMSMTASRQKEIAMISYQGESVKQLSLAFWKDIPNQITSLKDIATSDNHVIAVQVGTYQEVYLSKIEGIEAKALDGTAELIMDLRYGKSQAVLYEPHIADAMKVKFPQIQILPINLSEEEWVLGNGIGIKKDNHDLIDKIETATKELKEEGSINKLEQKWFGEGQHVS